MCTIVLKYDEGEHARTKFFFFYLAKSWLNRYSWFFLYFRSTIWNLKHPTADLMYRVTSFTAFCIAATDIYLLYYCRNGTVTPHGFIASVISCLRWLRTVNISYTGRSTSALDSITILVHFMMKSTDLLISFCNPLISHCDDLFLQFMHHSVTYAVK